MRRPGGYLVVAGAAGVAEADTFTCRHCQRVRLVRPKERPEDLGGLCRVCMGLVCPDCAGGACVPFERRLEMAEARGRLFRDIAIEG
jgi:hypothetical protein